MQVGGAQRSSMVHSVVMYSQGGAQGRSHKPIITKGLYKLNFSASDLSQILVYNMFVSHDLDIHTH